MSKGLSPAPAPPFALQSRGRHDRRRLDRPARPCPVRPGRNQPATIALQANAHDVATAGPINRVTAPGVFCRHHRLPGQGVQGCHPAAAQETMIFYNGYRNSHAPGGGNHESPVLLSALPVSRPSLGRQPQRPRHDDLRPLSSPQTGLTPAAERSNGQTRRLCTTAAPIKPANSGCGAKGRLFNSG